MATSYFGKESEHPFWQQQARQSSDTPKQQIERAFGRKVKSMTLGSVWQNSWQPFAIYFTDGYCCHVNEPTYSESWNKVMELAAASRASD